VPGQVPATKYSAVRKVPGIKHSAPTASLPVG
jgi:hypothetical protein